MRNIRARKAFTLIELIVVIIIIGILAGLAVVAYQAVINRADDEAGLTTAKSVAREVQALAAFDAHSTSGAATDAMLTGYATDAQADAPSGVTVSFTTGNRGITVQASNGQSYCVVTGDGATTAEAQKTARALAQDTPAVVDNACAALAV